MEEQQRRAKSTTETTQLLGFRWSSPAQPRFERLRDKRIKELEEERGWERWERWERGTATGYEKKWLGMSYSTVIPCYTMLYHVIPCYTMLYHWRPNKSRVAIVSYCTMLPFSIVGCWEVSRLYRNYPYHHNPGKPSIVHIYIYIHIYIYTILITNQQSE